MKKLLGILIIMLLLICFTVTCFAFPAPGKYESKERASAIGGPLPYGRYRVEIIKSNNGYSGTIDITAKGGMHLLWSVPLSISKNQDGRYPIDDVRETSMPNYNRVWEIEEVSDGSFNLYAGSRNDNKRYFASTVHLIK